MASSEKEYMPVDPEDYEFELKELTKTDKQLTENGRKAGWRIVAFLLLFTVPLTLFFLYGLFNDAPKEFNKLLEFTFRALVLLWPTTLIFIFYAFVGKTARGELLVTNDTGISVKITGDDDGNLIEISDDGSTRSITKEEALDIMKAGEVKVW